MHGLTLSVLVLLCIFCRNSQRTNLFHVQIQALVQEAIENCSYCSSARCVVVAMMLLLGAMFSLCGDMVCEIFFLMRNKFY